MDTIDGGVSIEVKKLCSEAGFEDLREAKKYGITYLNREQTKKELGYCLGDGSVKFEYINFNREKTGFARFRFLNFTGKGKYRQNKEGVALYIPPTYSNYDFCNDVTLPIIITEGEKKALAIAKKTHHKCIALGGVYSFRSKIQDFPLCPQFQEISFNKRTVYICFDNDVESNPSVADAELILASILTGLGAQVFRVRLPEDTKGVDDYLKKYTDTDFEYLLTISHDNEFQEPKGSAQLISKYGILGGRAMSLRDGDTLSFPKFKIQVGHLKDKIFRPVDPESQRASYKIKYSADVWFESKYTMRFRGKTFNPHTEERVIRDKEGELYFNEYTGFDTAPLPGRVDIWLDFLKAFFSDEPELQVHYENWLAHLLRYPYKRQARILVIRGTQGTGKSTLLEAPAKIIGKMAGIYGSDALTRHFDYCFTNKIYVTFNEATEASRQAVSFANKIKNIATASEIQIDLKYIPSYTIRNYVNLSISTNSAYAHRVFEDSRRELIIQPAECMSFIPEKFVSQYSPEKLAQLYPGYWDATKYRELHNWLDDTGYNKILNYYLHVYNLDPTYTGLEKAPESAVKKEMVKDSLYGWQQYFDELEPLDLLFIVPQLEYYLAIEKHAEVSGGINSCSRAFKAYNNHTKLYTNITKTITSPSNPYYVMSSKVGKIYTPYHQHGSSLPVTVYMKSDKAKTWFRSLNNEEYMVNCLKRRYPLYVK